MVKSTPIVISSAVEGNLDEAIIRRLLTHVNAIPSSVYGKKGKLWLRQKIGAYNNAAHHSPWVVLVDLNHKTDCAPPLLEAWLPRPAQYMCFRVAVREAESWLLADRDRIAAFLKVALSRLPQNPDDVDYPKNFMVGLAGRSRRSDIREDMVPRPGSGRKAGAAYTSRLIEFVISDESGWRPDVAAKNSESLHRCLNSLSQLVDKCS